MSENMTTMNETSSATPEAFAPGKPDNRSLVSCCQRPDGNFQFVWNDGSSSVMDAGQGFTFLAGPYAEAVTLEGARFLVPKSEAWHLVIHHCVDAN